MALLREPLQQQALKDPTLRRYVIHDGVPMGLATPDWGESVEDAEWSWE
jgi:hypothetical protein